MARLNPVLVAVLVLCALVKHYRPFNAHFFELFNSYYEALGPRQGKDFLPPEVHIVHGKARKSESFCETSLNTGSTIANAQAMANARACRKPRTKVTVAWRAGGL